MISSPAGCDTILTITLTEAPPYEENLEAEICVGGTYEVNGEVYTDAGTYEQLITSENDCAELLTITLTESPLIEASFEDQICVGATVEINGEEYDSPGDYSQIVPSAVGCDTILSITLVEAPMVIESLDAQICEGGSIEINGEIYTDAGMYEQMISSAEGCDTLLNIILEEVPTIQDAITQQLCPGETIEINGEVYDTAGSYEQLLPSTVGCDTLLVILLEEGSNIEETLEDEICPGTSIEINGEEYNDVGTYQQLIPASIGCDTVLNIILTEMAASEGSTDAEVCIGETIEINGENYDAAGTYEQTLTGSNGCDSILTITITETPLINSSVEENICAGTSVTINNETYDDAGMYEQILVNADGCDTLLTINITSTETTSDSLSYVLCDQEEVEINGENYSDEGDYEQILSGSNGCDSILSIFILESESTSTDNMVTLCEGDTLFTEDNIIFTEGTFQDIFASLSGCDSVVNYTVTFAPSYQEIIDVEINSGDIITINGEDFSAYGQYNQTLSTVDGCDSIITINVAENQNVIHYDMEDCEAGVNHDNFVYTEFTANYPENLACGSMQTTIAYRNEPEINMHSCTPGLAESIAICVSSLDDCAIDFNSDKKVIFQVDLGPDEDAIVQLNVFRFFQKAPENFDWIDGDNGPNNYPTLFAVRILKDGQEIFRQEDISTTLDWAEYVMDFSSDPAFEVVETTSFQFEMIGYCLTGNGSPVSAWDLDDIKISTNCRPVSAINRMMAGKLSTIDGQNIEGVRVNLEGGSLSQECMSTALGNYTFPTVPMYQDYKIEGYNNDDHLNGVSTLDIILIQRHVLGIQDLVDPLLMRAADVNDDGSVSSVDLLELRKLILGIYDKFPQNTSWNFMMEDQNMNAQNFMNLEDAIQIYNLEDNYYNLNFKGIKTGDVNLSASANKLVGEGSIESRSSNNLSVYIDENEIESSAAGTWINFRVKEDIDLYGFQFTLELNANNFLELKSGIINMNSSNYSYNNEKGELYISWNQDQSKLMNESELLFSLFISDKDISNDAILITSADFLDNEAYNSQLEKMGVELEWRDEEPILETKQSISIYPNPVKEFLFVNADQKFEGGQIEIININGSLISKMPWDGNEQRLDVTDLVEGMYYIRVTEQGNQTYISSFIRLVND